MKTIARNDIDGMVEGLTPDETMKLARELAARASAAVAENEWRYWFEVRRNCEVWEVCRPVGKRRRPLREELVCKSLDLYSAHHVARVLADYRRNHTVPYMQERYGVWREDETGDVVRGLGR